MSEIASLDGCKLIDYQMIEHLVADHFAPPHPSILKEQRRDHFSYLELISVRCNDMIMKTPLDVGKFDWENKYDVEEAGGFLYWWLTGQETVEWRRYESEEIILCWLCTLGAIDPGTYYVRISW